MTTALLLIVFGVLTRLVPHPMNFVPMGALALYAGARLPRAWAYVAPLAAMIISDLVIDNIIWPGFARSLTDPVRLTIYGTMMATVAIGNLPRKDAHPATRTSLSLLASCLFFTTTNFAVWASGEVAYPEDAAGLIACFAAAVPFFQNTLLADLLGTGFLFGLDALEAPRERRRRSLLR
jgi:Family of unknown function (DUF6580)